MPRMTNPRRRVFKYRPRPSAAPGAVNQATETDAAFVLARTKGRAPGLLSEADTAQAAGRIKTVRVDPPGYPG